MVWAWVLSHTVFKKVPQKHNDTLTNMGLSALRPKQHAPLLLLLSWQSSGTLKVGALPNYWSAFPWNVRQNVFDSAVQTTRSTFMLGTTWRVLVIILCWLLSQMVRIITSQGHQRRTSRLFFFFFFKENSPPTLICCNERPHGLVTMGRSDTSLKI